MSDPIGKVLNAEEIEQVKQATIFSQDEVNYVTLSATPGQACANCPFYRSTGYDGIDWPHCHLVDGWPKPIEPTGWCERWEAVVEPDYTMEPIPVVIVDVDVEDSAEASLKVTGAKGIIQTIKGAIQNILNPAEPDFQVFKAIDGKKYWIARHTGKFKDRHGEILADKAHDEYVAAVEAGKVEMPELWTFHTKGTSHGQADVVWKAGGFVLALGHFDETPEAEKAFTFYQAHKGQISLSHGFYYVPQMKIDGVYYAYNTFEISTLLNGEEAFPYTSFEEIETMALSEAQRQRVLAIGGETMLQRAEAADQKAVTDTKAQEGQGTAYKGYGNFDERTVPAVDLPVLKDMASRLEAAEAAVKAVDDLKATLDALAGLPETVKSLMEQNKALTDSNNTLLETVNNMNKQAEELNALKPPASKSEDTLLDSREKSIVEQVAKAAETESMPSLVKQMVEGQTTVSQV